MIAVNRKTRPARGHRAPNSRLHGWKTLIKKNTRENLKKKHSSDSYDDKSKGVFTHWDKL